MLSTQRAFPELSYASPHQPPLTRWFIRSVEGLSGRDRFASLYAFWRSEIAPTGERVFGRMLDLIDVRVRYAGCWPQEAPDTPLVIVANHPFGIGDGIAILALAEQLRRPFRVMIHKDLLRVREMEPYSLPIDFSDDKEAARHNIAVRHETLRSLRSGTVVVVFPAGGVATAPRGFGRAEDLPWKLFVARLVREAKASVLPVHFRGQNGRLFHLVSRPMALADREHPVARFVGKLSLTLRTSLLVAEFARLSGRTIDVRVGKLITPEELAGIDDRKSLLIRLKQAVDELAACGPDVGRRQVAAFGRLG